MSHTRKVPQHAALDPTESLAPWYSWSEVSGQHSGGAGLGQLGILRAAPRHHGPSHFLMVMHLVSQQKSGMVDIIHECIHPPGQKMGLH